MAFIKMFVCLFDFFLCLLLYRVVLVPNYLPGLGCVILLSSHVSNHHLGLNKMFID